MSILTFAKERNICFMTFQDSAIHYWLPLVLKNDGRALAKSPVFVGQTTQHK